MQNCSKTNQEVILDTIDSLRRRKARPDLERICHMVERKYGVSAAEVECELERLVDDEIVYKVEYKGSTSYRNAAKWKQSHLSGTILNSTDSSRLLIEAVEELSHQTKEDHAGPSTGPAGSGDAARRNSSTARCAAAAGQIAIEDIENYVLSRDPDTRLTRMRLHLALGREAFSGRLVKVAKGVFSLPSKELQDQRSVNQQVPETSKKVDRVKKRKRIRKTHGPDFEHEPLSKQPSYDQRCDYCSFHASCNKFDEPEELLNCKDCNLKVHPSCMRYSAELAERSRLSPWQCMDCKTCLVCNESGDADKLLFCDSCDKGYHMACHYPPVFKQPEGKWVCYTCERDDELECYSSDGSATLSSNEDLCSTHSSPSDPGLVLPTGEVSLTRGKVSPDVATPSLCNAARLPEQSASPGGHGTHPDPQVPNPVEWTIEDVVQYFSVHGFTEQCIAFKEQEIDGKSLLLMKRLDVLKGLSIKLGPALKIYNHVVKLQLCSKHGSSKKSSKGSFRAAGTNDENAGTSTADRSTPTGKPTAHVAK